MEISERKMPWWFIVIIGVLIIVVSIFLLADRVSGLVLLMWLVALGAVASGVFNLAMALKNKDDNSASIPLLVHGLLDIVLVLLIITIPNSQALLGVIIACWLIVFGVFEIVGARKREDSRHSKIGALLIVIGTLLIIIPLALRIDYVILIAIIGLCFGVFRVVLGILIKIKYDERTSSSRANLL